MSHDTKARLGIVLCVAGLLGFIMLADSIEPVRWGSFALMLAGFYIAFRFDIKAYREREASLKHRLSNVRKGLDLSSPAVLGD